MPQHPTKPRGPPVQHQQNSNPFVAPLAAAPLPLTHPNVQRKSKKKKRELSTPAAPVVPKPREVMTPASAVPLAPSQATPTPPRQKWALVPEDAPELEPSKPNEELKATQAAANKLQGIVEAAVICLVEHRTESPLEKFGITEAYLPQRKIEVLSGTAAIRSIIIVGIEYLKIHGLPCISQDRLLGKCKF